MSMHNKKLETSINSIVKDKSNNEINVLALTDFDWDKAFLIEPYNSILETTGVDFKDPSNISMRDDIFLLIFLYEDEVTQYIEMNRYQTSFSIENNDYLTPSEDVITINR